MKQSEAELKDKLIYSYLIDLPLFNFLYLTVCDSLMLIHRILNFIYFTLAIRKF